MRKVIFVFIFSLFIFVSHFLFAQDINTKLLQAAKNDELEAIKVLVKKGADINTQDENRATVLMWAAYKGNLEAVKFLVKNKADFNKKGIIYIDEKKTGYYGNLLGIAAGENKAKILKYLLEECKINIDDKEYNPETGKSDGWTAIQWAASLGHTEIVKILIEKGANLNTIHADSKGTALIYSIENSHYEIAKLLIENDADVNLYSENHWSALHYFARENKPELLKLALSKGAKVNLQTAAEAYTPLIFSAYNGYMKCCYLLVKAGADIDIKDKTGKTAMDYAEEKKHSVVVSFLKNPKKYKNESEIVTWNELNEQSVQLYKAGEFEKSFEIDKKALKQAEIEFGKEHENYALACENLALSYNHFGNYDKAKPLYLETIKIREKIYGKEHALYAKACNNLASFYKDIGDYDNAKQLNIESKNITEKIYGKEHSEYAISCINLGSVYESLGDYSQAEKLFLESIEILEKYYGKENSTYATVSNNLGRLYQRLGNFSKSEIFLLESNTVIKKVLGTKHPNYAMSCNNLGSLYHEIGQYEKSEEFYYEAKAINEEILGKNHPDMATVFNNLGALYQEMKKYNAAETMYLNAKLIDEKTLGKNHPAYGIDCNNLATVYSALGKYKKAENLYLESKAIDEKIYGKVHPSYALGCLNLAFVYQKKADYSESYKYFLEALDLKQKELQQNFKNLTEQEKNLYIKKNKNFFDYLSEFLLISQNKLNPEQSNNLLKFQADVFLQMKSILLASTQKMKKRILNSGDKNLVKAYEKWTDLRNQYAKFPQFSKAKLNKMQINLDSLLNEINKKEKYLSEKSEDFKTAFAPKIPKWQELQKNMKAGEIAVEIFRIKMSTDSIVYAALLTTNETKNAPEMIILANNGKKLEADNLKYYRTKMKAQHKDLLSYQNFWLALDKKLATFKTVFLSPDGVYNQINPNTLYDPDQQKYVFDKYQIQLVTNLRDKVYPNQTTPKIYKDLLIGNPKYEINESEYKKQQKANQKNERGENFGTDLNLEKITFKPLDGTETEVNAITELLKKQNHETQTYLGTDATEEVVKQTKNPIILHIATHGFFVQVDDKNPRKAMMNSGIALAGITNYAKANDKPNIEDGLLTAYEAQNLELDNTELVVLSACETGLGEVSSGEGVYGLQRAFKVAGAQTIIMSLWTVSDQATQELMTLFYEFWSQTKDKKLAFTRAQQEIKKKYTHPYFWGAFVIVE